MWYHQHRIKYERGYKPMTKAELIASVAKKEGYLQYYSLYDFIKENYSE